jgi:hypothetical protein
VKKHAATVSIRPRSGASEMLVLITRSRWWFTALKLLPLGAAAAHKPCAASVATTQTRNDVGQSSSPDAPVSLPWKVEPSRRMPKLGDSAAPGTHSRRSGRWRPAMLKCCTAVN